MKVSKEVRSIDLANEDLVRGLVSTLNESAQVAWFEKAVKMLDDQLISVRGLKATISKASDSTWLKESHVPYFVTARALRKKSGGDKVALKKVITTVQDAKRAWKSEEFAAKFEQAQTFKQFADSIPARESKARGAGAQTGSEKDSEADALVGLTADEIIERTLISLAELTDLSISNVEMAEKLHKGLGGMIRNAKRVKSPTHPTGAKVSA